MLVNLLGRREMLAVHATFGIAGVVVRCFRLVEQESGQVLSFPSLSMIGTNGLSGGIAFADAVLDRYAKRFR